MTRLPLSRLGDIVAFCDPAGGKLKVKRLRARSAITVLAQDWYHRIFLLYAWAMRCSTDKLVDQLFWVQDQFQPRVFGIEANAMQVLFANVVNREAKLRMKSLRVRPVWQPTGVEKPYRNRTIIQPVIDEGRLLMQDSQVEAWSELATHPMNPVCDLVDSIASSIELLPKRVAAQQREEEEVKLLRYLRRTGASPRQIDARIQALRAKKPIIGQEELRELRPNNSSR